MCFLLIEKVVGQAEKGDAGGITPSGTGSRVAPAARGEFVAIHLEEGRAVRWASLISRSLPR
jgi:hypothetical protein